MPPHISHQRETIGQLFQCHSVKEVLSRRGIPKHAPFVVFSFPRKMAATDVEQCSTDTSKEPNQCRGVKHSYLCAKYYYCKASIDSGNNLLQERVSRKRSSPDNNGQSSKRRKPVMASQKASTLSSDDEETMRCFRESTYAASNDTSDADALRFFGDDIGMTISPGGEG